MESLESMIKTWHELIDIANNTMETRPETGYLIRRQFNLTMASGKHSEFSATDLIHSMGIITNLLAREGENQVYLAGQLAVLTTLLASYFPATTGFAAIAYECAVKTMYSDKVICRN